MATTIQSARLERTNKATSTAPHATEAQNRRAYLDLFLVSFLILFFELACIRWFGSMVVYLTFFTNIVLLATFLGMSVGCLSASKGRDWLPRVMPLFLLAVVLAYGILRVHGIYGQVMVNVGGQGSPQQVYFGTEYRATDISKFVVPLELLAGVFFVLIAFVFVGLGQVMGVAFNQARDRLRAYISNIVGSLAGIAVFALSSYLWATPMVWFAVVVVLWLYFLKRRTLLQLYCGLAVVILTGFLSYNNSVRSPYQSRDYHDRSLIWSPYYKIVYTPETKSINTNNIAHQAMVQIEESGPAYSLPHLLNRDAGRPPFENVLIIGAGSGNDVSAALANGAKHVDAVEIDPAIQSLGRSQHANHPYQDPRVTVHIDDGRSFLRKTDQKYDLVIYALVDSLVLHSGYSSLRLESFLFTKNAFEDVRARLRPGGVFAVYNFFRQGWIAGRIASMSEETFGSKPIVITLPYAATIRSEDQEFGRLDLILSGANSPALAAISQQFAQHQSFWVNTKPSLNAELNGFGPQPPAKPGLPSSDWNKIAPSALDTAGIGPLPTDDWPFLYLRGKIIPGLNLRSILLIGGLSLAMIYMFSPVRRVQPNWRMFFLGAGFMLIETKSVVHMALLFGSTWLVNSVVFFAILVMILASNVYVLALKPRKLWPYYLLLVTSLAINIVVPMSRFLALPGWEKVAASCAVVFVPIFFAGIVFGTLFRDSSQPDIDFGSNIAGAILGGLCESLSLLVGFNYLLAIAVLCYLLSAIPNRSAVALSKAA
jgi:SAM-dependent methyltransferase